MRAPPRHASMLFPQPLKVAVFERDWARRSRYRVSLEAAGCETMGFNTVEGLRVACRARGQRFDVLLLACAGDVFSVARCLALVEVDVLRTVPLLLVVEERQIHAVHEAVRGGPFDFVLPPFGDEELCSRVWRLCSPHAQSRPRQTVAQLLNSPVGP